MSDKINDGGPAFPHKTQWDGITPAINYHGISMIDYFAAAALTGLMADGGGASWDDDATHAYLCADAMLKAMEAK
jgi:hypothetical protein